MSSSSVGFLFTGCCTSPASSTVWLGEVERSPSSSLQEDGRRKGLSQDKRAFYSQLQAPHIFPIPYTCSCSRGGGGAGAWQAALYCGTPQDPSVQHTLTLPSSWQTYGQCSSSWPFCPFQGKKCSSTPLGTRGRTGGRLTEKEHARIDK